VVLICDSGMPLPKKKKEVTEMGCGKHEVKFKEYRNE
jgi:D-ribose pyranose/furanose isomerase RbsD